MRDIVMNKITIRSPAKINLCLSVLGKRTDGYHDVEMLMQMVGLYDEVTASLGGNGVSVTCDQSAVPTGEKNIAWKAATEMLRAVGSTAGLVIEIKKNIPVEIGRAH